LKIGICASSWVGYEILLKILPKDNNIQFVITTEDDSYEEKIHRLCMDNEVRCYRKKSLNDDFLEIQTSENIDLAFLLWWPKIISQAVINSVKNGFINTHPSYLPYNRGKHPYFWSIVDGTPFGVTIHFVDAKIDHGKILFRQEIDVDMTDTGESLYNKSISKMVEVFVNNYDKLSSLNVKEITFEQLEFPSLHFSSDIEDISHIDLNKEYKAGDLINIIRGRTFGNGPSSIFEHNGEQFYIRIKTERVNGSSHNISNIKQK